MLHIDVHKHEIIDKFAVCATTISFHLIISMFLVQENGRRGKRIAYPQRISHLVQKRSIQEHVCVRHTLEALHPVLEVLLVDKSKSMIVHKYKQGEELPGRVVVPPPGRQCR